MSQFNYNKNVFLSGFAKQCWSHTIECNVYVGLTVIYNQSTSTKIKVINYINFCFLFCIPIFKFKEYDIHQLNNTFGAKLTIRIIFASDKVTELYFIMLKICSSKPG